LDQAGHKRTIEHKLIIQQQQKAIQTIIGFATIQQPVIVVIVTLSINQIIIIIIILVVKQSDN